MSLALAMMVASGSCSGELFGSGFHMQSWTLAVRLPWKFIENVKVRRVSGVKDSLLCQRETGERNSGLASSHEW